MRNFPLQTIFLNLFASAIIFFPKAPSCKQFFFYIFFTMLSSLVLKIFQLFFEKKKITNTKRGSFLADAIANNYYFSHLYAPVVVYSLLFFYTLFTVLIPICS